MIATRVSTALKQAAANRELHIYLGNWHEIDSCSRRVLVRLIYQTRDEERIIFEIGSEQPTSLEHMYDIDFDLGDLSTITRSTLLLFASQKSTKIVHHRRTTSADRTTEKQISRTDHSAPEEQALCSMRRVNASRCDCLRAIRHLKRAFSAFSFRRATEIGRGLLAHADLLRSRERSVVYGMTALAAHSAQFENRSRPRFDGFLIDCFYQAYRLEGGKIPRAWWAFRIAFVYFERIGDIQSAMTWLSHAESLLNKMGMDADLLAYQESCNAYVYALIGIEQHQFHRAHEAKWACGKALSNIWNNSQVGKHRELDIKGDSFLIWHSLIGHFVSEASVAMPIHVTEDLLKDAELAREKAPIHTRAEAWYMISGYLAQGLYLVAAKVAARAWCEVVYGGVGADWTQIWRLAFDLNYRVGRVEASKGLVCGGVATFGGLYGPVPPRVSSLAFGGVLIRLGELNYSVSVLGQLAMSEEPRERARANARLGWVLAAKGEVAGAERAFDAALGACSYSNDPKTWLFVLLRLLEASNDQQGSEATTAKIQELILNLTESQWLYCATEIVQFFCRTKVFCLEAHSLLGLVYEGLNDAEVWWELKTFLLMTERELAVHRGLGNAILSSEHLGKIVRLARNRADCENVCAILEQDINRQR